MRIMITGAAGYVGSVLIRRLLRDSCVQEMVLVDRKPRSEGPGDARCMGRLHDEIGHLEDESFMARLEAHLPLDAVIHAAFQMRAGYGRESPLVEATNITSCRHVFEFTFRHRVPRLIYFSSAAAYGALPGNTADRFLGEHEPLRERMYPYGVHKRRVEELLRAMYDERKPATHVVVIRPCSITGPRWQREPSKRVSLISFLKRLLPAVPEISPEWARQFIHEDDLAEAVTMLLSSDRLGPYEVFNLAPPDYLTASDIAHTLGKRRVKVPAWLVRATFALLWRVSRGRMPFPPGAINSFRYPINMDGSRITRLGFTYRHGSRESLLAE